MIKINKVEKGILRHGKICTATIRLMDVRAHFVLTVTRILRVDATDLDCPMIASIITALVWYKKRDKDMKIENNIMSYVYVVLCIPLQSSQELYVSLAGIKFPCKRAVRSFKDYDVMHEYLSSRRLYRAFISRDVELGTLSNPNILYCGFPSNDVRSRGCPVAAQRGPI
jgi:hypothetical protein